MAVQERVGGGGAPPTFHAALAALQTEYHRHQTEKLKWSVERAQLIGQITRLEGELKARSSVADLLTRRVRMLEFALRQERAARDAGTPPAAVGGGSGTGTVALPDASSVGATPPAGLESLLAGGPRASQIVIRDFLAQLGYGPEMDVSTMVQAHQAAQEALAAAHRAAAGRKEPPMALEQEGEGEGEAGGAGDDDVIVHSGADNGKALGASGKGFVSPPSIAPPGTVGTPPAKLNGTALPAPAGGDGDKPATGGRRRFADRVLPRGTLRNMGSPPAVAGLPAASSGGEGEVVDDVVIHHDAAEGGRGSTTAGPSKAASPAMGGGKVTGADGGLADSIRDAMLGDGGDGSSGSGRGLDGKVRPQSIAAATAGGGAVSVSYKFSQDLRGHTDVVRRVAWLHPDDTGGLDTTSVHVPLLVSTGDDGCAKVWALPQYACWARSVATVGGDGVLPVPPPISAILAANKDVEVEPVRTLRGHRGPMYAVAQVAWRGVGGDDGAAGTESVTPWARLSTYLATQLRANGCAKPEDVDALVAASSATSLLVAGGADGKVRMWMKPRDVMGAPASGGDGRGVPTIIPPGYDFSAAACLPVATLPVSSEPVWSITAAPAGITLSTLRCVDTPGGAGGTQPARAIPAALASLTTPAVPIIAVGAADGLVSVWTVWKAGGKSDWACVARYDVAALVQAARATAAVDASTSGLPAVPSSASGAPRPTAVLFDRSCRVPSLYIGTTHRALLKLNLTTGTVTWMTVAGHASLPATAAVTSALSAPGQVTALALHPVLPTLFAGHADAAVGVACFHTDTGACIRTQPAHASALTDLSVDPTGLTLATIGNDAEVRVWAADSGDLPWRYKAHSWRFEESGQAVAFHPSRPNLLACGGADGLVKLFTALPAAAPVSERQEAGGEGSGPASGGGAVAGVVAGGTGSSSAGLTSLMARLAGSKSPPGGAASAVAMEGGGGRFGGAQSPPTSTTPSAPVVAGMTGSDGSGGKPAASDSGGDDGEGDMDVPAGMEGAAHFAARYSQMRGRGGRRGGTGGDTSSARSALANRRRPGGGGGGDAFP